LLQLVASPMIVEATFYGSPQFRYGQKKNLKLNHRRLLLFYLLCWTHPDPHHGVFFNFFFFKFIIKKNEMKKKKVRHN
jgi:hypothetical protein